MISSAGKKVISNRQKMLSEDTHQFRQPVVVQGCIPGAYRVQQDATSMGATNLVVGIENWHYIVAALLVWMIN